MAAIVNADAVVPCGAEQARVRLDEALGAGAVQRAGPDRTSLSDLHWTSTRRLRALLPTVDLGVAVTAIDDVSCLLSVAGTYRPPFGWLGSLADRAIMHRFAAATAEEFTTRLAATLAHNPEEGSS